MKKLFFFLAFITWMVMNGQVVVDTVFTTTEEIGFVSDDGGGIYTVSGPGAGSDGFLAIYDEGADSWEVKYFPPRNDLGSVHNAEVWFAYTLQSGTTIAAGLVANSASQDWIALRRYQVGIISSSQEIVIYSANIKLFPPIGDNLYARVIVGTGGNAWGLSPGKYLVKINSSDISSLEWVYPFSSGYDVASNDVLISTAKVYRRAIQALPNGNIAVTVGNSNGYELWEFDPATGQKLGVIDDSYTDYDRDGTEELQYQFHRWKVVDGVLFHEFWNDPNNSQDQNVGHWEKLEVPGWAPGSGNANVSWDPSQLQVTAVSDWGVHDSFRKVFIDPWVDASGKLRWNGFYLSENLSLYKNEVDDIVGGNGRDEWTRPNGERMVMTLHSLLRVTYNEQFPNHIEVVNGNNVVEARNNEFYNGTSWEPRSGESTVVVAHSAMPQAGDNPDPSWWSIPSGFHYTGNTPIEVSHRPGEEGMLFFRVGAVEDGGSSYPNELILRVWVIDANTVGVPETEISGLSLYPNPVQDFLTVEADMDVDAVRVYNMSGIAVKEVSGDARVFMGDLPVGVYVVEVTAGEAVSRRKVIKK